MNGTKNRDYTVKYSVIPFLYWGAFCAMNGFASYYLLSIGLHNTMIGVMVAVAGIISSVLQPIVAGYADRPESASLKKIVMLLAGIQAIGFAVLSVCYRKNMWLCGILYGAGICLHHILTPLINSLATETINQGKQLNYGAARAVGSIGYAAVAYSLGALTVRMGSNAVPVMILIALIGLEIALFVFPFEKRILEKEHQAYNGVSGLAFFKRYKRYTFVLAGCILMFIGHIFINNYTLQVVQLKGAGTSEMGVAQAIAAVAELPVMFLFGWMLKKTDSRSWVKISSIFFSVKIVASYLAPNMPVFYGVQLFQMFGWGLLTVASVFYVNSIMEDSDKIKGQAYYTMTFTIGTVLGSLLGGVILDHYDAGVMLIAGSVISVFGSLIVFFGA